MERRFPLFERWMMLVAVTTAADLRVYAHGGAHQVMVAVFVPARRTVAVFATDVAQMWSVGRTNEPSRLVLANGMTNLATGFDRWGQMQCLQGGEGAGMGGSFPTRELVAVTARARAGADEGVVLI